MGISKIEWTDKVWNPITGCFPVSEGCQHCYAKRMANRLKGRYGYPKDDPFSVTFHPDRLDEPLRWKKPSRIFVCSMGDLFHENIPLEVLKNIFKSMESCATNHKFLLLTKRPQRMVNWFKEYYRPQYIGTTLIDPNYPDTRIWAGVSVENQRTADERIPILLQIPAAKRFVSVEPMLGAVNIYPTPMHKGTECLDWVICGGETGPGARPMHPDWVRSLRDQSQAAGVPFFFKSWGDYIEGGCGLKGHPMHDAGWSRKGRILDDREWNEFPEV